MDILKANGLNNKSEFSKKLKLLRKRKELSYEQLSKAITGNDNAKPLLWRYETGRSEPGLKMFIKLADYFGVTLDWLAGFGDVEKIQHAGKSKYYNAIDMCIEREISPARLEQIIEVIGK